MSHFRSSTLTVDQTGLYTYVFNGQLSYRASTYSYATVGTIIGTETFFFGDGSSTTLYLKVIAINSAEDYLIGQIVDSLGNPLQHTYASAGTYEAYFESGDRIVTNDQFSEAGYRSEIMVTPGTLNDSPVTSVPAIVQVADNTIFTYQIPAFDPNGDPLTYKIGYSQDFLGSYYAPWTTVAPAGLTLSSTGLLTWDVRDVGGAAVSAGQRYAMALTVNDGKTSTPVDFILQIVNTANNQAPVFTVVPPTQNLALGATVSLAVLANDPNGNLSNIQVLNPPAGMTTDFHASHSELHIDFTASTAGTFVVTVQAVDAGGLTTNTSITFNVASNGPPVVANPIADVHVDEDRAFSVQVPANSFSDPDGNAITYSARLASDAALPGWLSFDAATRTFSGTPPQDFNGTISVKVVASDGNGQVSDTFDLIVDPIDDAPDLDTSITQGNYLENSTLTVDTNMTLTDVDGGVVTGAVVAIASGYVAGEDSLGFTPMYGITGSFNAATGQLVLSGNASAAHYEAALRTVTYTNSSDAPSTGDRQIEFNASSSETLFYSGTGHFYQFVAVAPSANLTWDQANAAASASQLFGLQGYLTTITSAGEQAFVQSRLQGTGWMGATDVATEGNWRWVTGPEGLANGGTGTQFWSGGAGGAAVGGAYANWSPSEPNNFGNEDYGHFYAAGPWNDFPLNKAGEISGYVVEYGGMPGDPLVDLTGSVTIKIEAVNDPVLIVAGGTVATGALAELGEGAAGEGAASATAAGTIAFSDLDDANGHSAGFVAQGANYLGTFALGAVDQQGNTVGWSFSVADAAIDNLAAGQVVTQTYTVTISDNQGSSADQPVTVTITGANDAPEIVLGGQAGIDIITGAPDAFVSSLGEPNTAYYAQTFVATSAALTGVTVPLDWISGAGPTDLRLLITSVRFDGSGFHPDQVLFESGEISVPVDSDNGFTLYSVSTGGLALAPGQQYAIILDGKVLADGISGVVSWQQGAPYADGRFYYLNTGSGSTRSADFSAGWSTYSVDDVAFRLSFGSTTSGSAIEAGSLDDGTPTAGKASAAGEMVATDVDQGDVLTWSGSADGLYGSFTISAQGNWTYTLDNGRAATQALVEGQVVTETFTATVADQHGATDSEAVTITVNGTNDAPVISDALSNMAGRLFEPGYDDTGGLRGTARTMGRLSASDVDGGATLSWSIAGGGDSPLGALTIDQNGVWTYTLHADAADSLALGVVAVETFVARVTDGEGGYAEREVRIEIIGSNDRPTIIGSTGQFTIAEATDGSPRENQIVHAAAGQVRFADVDLGDSHVATFVPAAPNYLGTFSVGPANEAGKSVGWSFSVPDSALDVLASGETLVQTYDLTITDANGLSVATSVTVYINGTNDAAVLSSANVVLLQSGVPVSASGDLSIDDVDGPDEFQPQAGTVGQHGSFSIDAAGQWTYQAFSANLGLAPGESLTDLFVVLAADGTPTSVSVTIAGSADGGVARPDHFVTDEATAIGAGLSLFADNGFGADTDPDNPLEIVAASGGALGQAHQLGSGALLRVDADGTFSYDPNDAFNTLNHIAGSANQVAYDSFSYTLSDGSTTFAMVRINGVNSPEDIILGQGASNGYLNAVIFGTSGNDRFMLQPGGTQGAYGNEGNDGFYFGGALNGQHLVDGGTGVDTLAIQGNYPALVLGGEITNVEVLLVLSGGDPRFGDTSGASYDYGVKTVDANVAAGAILTVQAGGLQPGEDLVFDGSPETDGAFRIFAGQGNDQLTGGAGNDGFFFGADGNLTGADRIVGGAGTDSLALRGVYVGADAVVLENASLSGIEVIVLLSGHTNEFGGTIVPAGFDYDLTLADGNVAAGQRLDIIAANLWTDESVRIDGRAELEGTLRILSGAGNDQLLGGAGGDVIAGGLGADTIDGGGGADLYVYRSALESTAAARDTLTLSAGDRIDLSAIDAKAGTAANDGFSFIGGAAFGGVAGELRASLQGGQWIVEGDVNGDGVADLVIAVSSAAPLVATDFVL